MSSYNGLGIARGGGLSRRVSSLRTNAKSLLQRARHWRPDPHSLAAVEAARGDPSSLLAVETTNSASDTTNTPTQLAFPIPIRAELSRDSLARSSPCRGLVMTGKYRVETSTSTEKDTEWTKSR